MTVSTKVDHRSAARETDEGAGRMICGTCQHENQQHARFCAECGSRLARTCPSCGAEPSPTAKFCDQCGSALAGAQASTAPTPAVRKQVTALFADLVGSTAFGERIDPEAVRTSLAPYFDILRSTIEDHAGTVAKFTGDGVMALFGVPEIAEDDALRAVAAGLDLHRRFHTFAARIRDRHGVGLGLRVGVNTGELVVGDDDADLVGDVLNTAARLEAACRPGRVLVGEETWRLTRSTIGYEVLGEVRVKGKAEPVATFEVVDDTDRVTDEVTPFVGRAEELAALRSVLDDARHRSIARLATVIGAPGVGKTRLAQELRAGSDARSFDLRFERRGSTTFTPIVDLLRELTGSGSADDVARLVEGHPEATRLGMVLASFLGHGESRTTEESFWAVRRLLELLASDGPVLVVVDDVQWAEPLFWDLLDHVVEWTEAPVLVVALARPELRELRPELTQAGRRVAAALWLEGLDAATTRELAARLLGIDELPAALADRLPESTEGNPLFVRELVQMLVDDGVLARDGDRWRLTIDADAIEVPPTILSLLASRVERLPDDERQVVELASVIGTEFDRGTLGAIAGSEITGHLGALIDRLRRKDLIEPSGAWSGDHPMYRFHHVLIRDAAYRRLLKSQRAELHQRAGRHAEASGDDDELDVIVAHHYEQVHRYRSELGELDDATRAMAASAVARLRSAAEQALAREDLPSAGNFALRALALVDDDADHERDELLLTGCEALLSSGDVERAAPLVDELYARSSDDRLAAWSDCFRAQLWSLTDPDHVTDADELAAAAAERLGELGDDAGVAKARLVRAGCLARLGRVGECEEELDLALAAARAAGDRRRTVAVLGAAPLAALWGPSPVARAGGRCLDVLRLLRITTASPAVEATSIRCQGMLEALRGRFDSARDKLDTSRTTARDLGLRQGLFETELFAGFVELWAGDPLAAEPHLRAAHEGLGRLGIGADAEQAGALLARALLVQGRVVEADVLATHALETAGQNLQTAITSRSVLAEIRAAQGEHDAAARLVDEAVAIVERTDVTLDHALTLLSAGRVAAAAGDQGASRRVGEAAQALLSSKGVTASLDASMPTIAADAALGARDRATIDGRFTNEAWDAMLRWDEARRRGDSEAIRSMYTPDFVSVSRIPIVGAAEGELDRDAAIASTDAIFELVGADGRFSMELVAVRGDDLFLGRFVAEVGGTDWTGYGVHHIVDGRGRSAVWFGEDQLLDAVDELEDRWLAGERLDAETVASLRLYRRARRSLADGDLRELRALLSDDFVARDHRGVGMLGERSVEEWVATMAPTGQGPFVAVPAAQPASGPSGGVILNVVTVGDSNWARGWTVYECRDGLLTALDHFELDDLGAAMAHYEAHDAGGRTPTAPDRTRLGNHAIELSRRLCEAVLARDRARVAALVADDFSTSDRGRLASAAGFSGRVDDAEGFVDFAVDIPTWGSDVDVLLDPIAIRGDRLALVRLVVQVDAVPFERLVVVETDGERTTHHANFDPDQLVDAVDELDDRWLAEWQPDVETAARMLLQRRLRRCLADWDPSELRSCLGDGFAAVDHRQLGMGERSVEDWIESMEPTASGSWVTLPAEVLAVGPRGWLVRLSVVVGDTWVRVLTVTLDGDGRIARLEHFDEDDLDAAWARYHELTRVETTGPRLTNLVWEMNARANEAVLARDRAAYRACFADGFVARLHEGLRPRDEVADIDEHVGVMFDEGELFGWERELIAVRGEDLCLIRLDVRAAAGASSVLLVSEISDGLIVRSDWYAIDQLDEAIAELDRRYLASLGFGDDHWIARQWPLLYSVDPDVQAPGLHSDFEYVEHRPLAYADTDGSGLLDIMRTLDVDVEIEAPAVDRLSERGMVFRRVERARDGSHERRFIAVLEFEDGLGRRFDVYADDDSASALARYDELAPDADAPLSNLAARTWLSLAERFRSGERTAFSDAAAPGLVFAGRRRSAPHFDAGVDHLRASIEAWAAVGLDDGRGEIVAIRGDRFCLVRSWVYGAGGELEFLVVIEVDDGGALVYHAVFDADQRVDALADLDRRWLATGGRIDPVVERLSRLMADGPFEAYADLFAPEFVCVDHREPGFGTHSRDEYLASTESIVGNITTHGVREYLAVDAGAALVRTGLRSERDGSDCDLYLLVRHDGQRFTRWEEYPVDARATALARYHEVTGSDLAPTPTNRSWEIAHALLVALGESDRARAAELLHADFTASPRERLMAGAHELDAARFLDRVDEFVRSAGERSAEHTLLAVRGDELCAVHSRYRFGEDEIEHVSVHDVRDGLLRHMTIHDAGDLLFALDELDERWRERGGPVWMIVLSRAARRSFAVPGFDRELLPFAPDFVTVDHRQVGMGRRTLEDFLASSSVLTPSDVVFPQFIAIDGDVSFYRVAITRHGDGFSWSLLHVSRGDEAGMHEIHVFDPEQFDQAQAWFEQMRSASGPAAGTRMVPPQTVVAGKRDGAPAGSDGHPVDTAGRVPSNRAWEASESLAHAWRQRDRERAASVLSEDFVLTNHNPFLMVAPHDTSCGKSDYLDIAFADDLAGSMTSVLIAVRGDDLCLFRMRITSASGDLTERLVLGERRNGGLARLDHFAPGQLREAQIELDRRWFTLLGLPADHPFFDQVVPAYDPTSAGISRMVGAEFEFVEHRRLGFPGGDLAQAMTNLDSQLAEVEIVVPRYLRLSRRTSLLERIERTLDGSAESGALVLCRFDDAGMLDHMELFDVADEVRAVARHDELTADDAGRVRSNRAWEIAQSASRARADGDHELFASMLSDDFVASSADPIMSTWGPDGVVDKSTYLEAASDPQFASGSSTDDALVAVRDDGLCLMRTTITTPDGDVWERCLVVEVSGELISRIDMFGHDQLGEALIELDRRWVELGGPGQLTECVARISQALRRADAAALRACVADDFVAVDHRSLGLGERNAAQWIESLTTLGSGTQLVVIDVVDHDRDIGVFWNRMRQPQDGSEWDFVHVASVDRGVVSRMDIFGADQMSTAREVYRRLRSERRSHSVQGTPTPH